jgi:hypothetical protein
MNLHAETASRFGLVKPYALPRFLYAEANPHLLGGEMAFLTGYALSGHAPLGRFQLSCCNGQ